MRSGLRLIVTVAHEYSENLARKGGLVKSVRNITAVYYFASQSKHQPVHSFSTYDFTQITCIWKIVSLSKSHSSIQRLDTACNL
jgi:hypothetical protein